MSTPFSRFLADDDGTSAFEYAIMVVLILVAALLAVSAFGGSTADQLAGAALELSETMGDK